MPKNPILSFRSSELIENYISTEIEKDAEKTRSGIAKALIIKAIRETPVSINRVHHAKDFTGVLIPCTRQKYLVEIGNRSAYHNPLVDASVCMTCNIKPCEAWEDIDSIKRVFPKPKNRS